MPERPRPWKPIDLEPVTPAHVRALLKVRKCRAGDQADRMLEQVTPRSEKIRLDLTKVRVQELGFPHGADLEDIYKKAAEFKLELCPGDVAAKLRVEYLEQPKDEILKIAMQPLIVDNHQLLFTLTRIFNQLWLGASAGLPKSHYGAKCQFVFVPT